MATFEMCGEKIYQLVANITRKKKKEKKNTTKKKITISEDFNKFIQQLKMCSLKDENVVTE